MSKIIGRDPNYEAVCTNCGTKFTFEKTELKPGEQIVGAYEHDTVVACPGCNKAVIVTLKMGATSPERAAEYTQQQLRDDYM